VLNTAKESTAAKTLSLGASNNLSSANDRSAFKAEAAKIETGHAPAGVINLNAGTAKSLPAANALFSLVGGRGHQ
jgi:hypothetical protein